MYQDNEQQIICGSVSAVLYQNSENAYSVIRMDTDAGETITVTGTLPSCKNGERLSVTGHWETHPQHGLQFSADYIEPLMPATASEIEKYLSSRIIRGIGPKTASRIVYKFGAETLNIMESAPERLAEVPGISLQKAKQIGESFRSQFGMRKLLEYLLSYELPSELTMPLYKAYGDLAQDALEEDPYILTDAYFSMDFPTVDAYAIKLGMLAEDSRRLDAAAVYTLRHNLNNGHVFIPADKLCAAAGSMINVDPDIIADELEELSNMGKIACDTLKHMRVCYLPEYYEAETYIASRIHTMLQTEPFCPSNLMKLFWDVSHSSSTDYADAQKDAILCAAQSSVMILTGGPGTGKTTTVNGILNLFDCMGFTTLLAAPTGRAAKRMSELCGRNASTIHRLLETQFDSGEGTLRFMHDESEPLKADAVIVDETSMVDLLLMEALLRALKPGCRLILVGDADQLPSVGAGNVFSDMIRSGKIPTVHLTEIFRQAQESLIVMNAHAINRGEIPDLTVKNKDFFFLTRKDNQRTAETIKDLCVRRLPDNMKIPPDQIQVLSPTRKGESGTAALNAGLQQALNPPAVNKPEHKYGKVIFRTGDRVMQIKNNYDILWKGIDGLSSGSGVFNGDVGKILSISSEEETVTVQFDDKLVSYTYDLLNQLELAYAMTVHKSQGSEYRAVVLSVSNANPYLLTRSILYTAVTRAKELLILVGNPDIVAQMVSNNRQSKRYSGLKLRLKKDE